MATRAIVNGQEHMPQLDDAAISEVIEMALSDHVSFAEIRAQYGLRR